MDKAISRDALVYISFERVIVTGKGTNLSDSEKSIVPKVRHDNAVTRRLDIEDKALCKMR